MVQTRELSIQGVPDNVPEDKVAILRSRLFRDVSAFLDSTGHKDIQITVGTRSGLSQRKSQISSEMASQERHKGARDEQSIEERARQYQSQEPLYDFEMLVVANSVMDNLLAAVDAIEVESTVFDDWGLKKIQPNPRTILNFYGEPGTGKTLAAHAIADRLGKPIMLASYADIESKFHGEGPKNLQAIFHAAESNDAVLFIDEADSLLSKRLTDVTSGSEQAINSMRSQLLICLEQFRGVKIFATNLVENYDKAFETRVRHIHFPLPDEECRQKIWATHLPKQLPQSADVSNKQLAKIDNVCGREIKEAVIDAANRAALRAKKQGKNPKEGEVTMQDLVDAIERKKAERITPRVRKIEPTEAGEISAKVQAALRKKEDSLPIE
ncbi:MAG: ATP-binding protein [Brasilonema octagenarum HA4186-MV1]|jgi:SpoVK/Ycf46/Vps4 family AAA+-type ATPase|nr:ATP-binding protein [Brasilonema octagenarum HA4186-MV1]